MGTLFDQATRTAELLQKRTPNGRLEMLDTALDEGYATMKTEHGIRYLAWHGLSTAGWNELEAIEHWITIVARHTGEAA